MPDTRDLSGVVNMPGVNRTNGQITLDYSGGTGLGAALYEGGVFRKHLLSVMAEADELVLVGTQWRIHITGDFVRSVNELDVSYAETGYTVERGANTAAAKTITQADGTFDVLFSPAVWIAPDAKTEEELFAGIAAAVRHTVLHEAGHVTIDRRGEDALKIFPTLDHLDEVESVWSRHLGFILRSIGSSLGSQKAHRAHFRGSAASAKISPISNRSALDRFNLGVHKKTLLAVETS